MQTGRTTGDFGDPSAIINCQSLSITCFDQRFPEAQPRRGLTFRPVSASDLTPAAEEPSDLTLTIQRLEYMCCTRKLLEPFEMLLGGT